MCSINRCAIFNVKLIAFYSFGVSLMITIVLIILVGNALLLFFLLRYAIRITMSLKSKNAAVGTLIGLLVIVVVAELIIAFAFWQVFLHQLPLLPLLTR